LKVDAVAGRLSDVTSTLYEAQTELTDFLKKAHRTKNCYMTTSIDFFKAFLFKNII
jgi:hypothetical protein